MAHHRRLGRPFPPAAGERMRRLGRLSESLPKGMVPLSKIFQFEK